MVVWLVCGALIAVGMILGHVVVGAACVVLVDLRRPNPPTAPSRQGRCDTLKDPAALGRENDRPGHARPEAGW